MIKQKLAFNNVKRLIQFNLKYIFFPATVRVRTDAVVASRPLRTQNTNYISKSGY